MSDRRARELERRWKASGSPEDRELFFNELVRTTGDEEGAQRRVYGIAEIDAALVKNVESRVVHLGSPLLVQLHNPRQRVPQTICRVLFRPVETDQDGVKHGYMFRMGSPQQVTCKTCLARGAKVARAKKIMAQHGVMQLRVNERPAREALGCFDQSRLRHVWRFTPWACTQGRHLWVRREGKTVQVCRGCDLVERHPDYASASDPITTDDWRLTSEEKS